MKPCFDAVTKHHSDTTIFLRGLSTSSRKVVTPLMCLTLSQNSPDETCCFLDLCSSSSKFVTMYVLSTCPLCMQVTNKSRVHTCPKLAEYPCCKLRLTVPLQRIRCMTCRYQHHCHLIAPCEYIQAHRQQVMTSNIALSGLLTSNIGMLAAIYTNTDRDCKTITLHYHCVTAANLCLDKSIRHGCCDLQQHSGQVVIGLFACCH